MEYEKKVIRQLIFSHSSNVSQLIRWVPSDYEGVLIDVLLSTHFIISVMPGKASGRTGKHSSSKILLGFISADDLLCDFGLTA